MNPLAILKVLSFIPAIFKLGKIFWNLPGLIKLGRSVGPIIHILVAEHRAPGICECKDLIHASAVLLHTGIIDLPGVDEEAIASKLEEIESVISCKAA